MASLPNTTATTQRSPGRPIGSSVRQNIIEILYNYKKLYGYEIYKIYIDIFPKITLRLIYYHLKKGVSLGEFKVASVEVKDGNYSWGNETENIIYELAENARPLGNSLVKEYMLKARNIKTATVNKI